jgi:hypothetical protein
MEGLKWIFKVEDGDWIHLAQCRAPVNTVAGPLVSQLTVNFLTSIATGTFSRTLLHGVSWTKN